MTTSRLSLHSDLCTILGTNNVYFQPPESLKMKYPCIVYSRVDISNQYASDAIYGQHHKYKVTVLDLDPDSTILKKMSEFKFAVFDRHYTANGVNHDQFIVTYLK